MRLLLGLIIFSGLILVSCGKKENAVPKPMGYFRIDFPEKTYQVNKQVCTGSFEHPTYSYILEKKSPGPDRCFQTLVFPYMKASLYLTYVKLDSNLYEHSEEYRKRAYEHRIKAQAINERQYINEERDIYGTTFDINGDVACNYIFYLTDSTDNFFAGSLFFEVPPNYDSLQPVIDFIEGDIQHMIETFSWESDSL